MGRPKIQKTKEERLREGISLLTQLKETGMKENTIIFQQLKKQITDWISTGEPYEESIDAPECGRTVMISLPRYNNRAGDIRLKVRQ
jgi:uncharacterized protein YaeQ